jgi:tetratricopeptide (TPR) repeat protein
MRSFLLTVCVAVLALAAPALAQSTMIKGKVVDAEGKPLPDVTVTIEFKGGVNRKFTTKSDKRGEFIQLLSESGPYQVSASVDKVGSGTAALTVRLGQTAQANLMLAPGGGAANPEAAKAAAALKRAFEEGVAANRAGNQDAAIAKFNEAIALVPNCHDCYYNIGVAQLAKKDEKAAEEAWKKSIEIKPDYPESLNALATLYNNQKRFDEAAAMSAKAASGTGGGGNADAVYNQGIILWNQGKIPEAKVKFEEALKLDANHAESHYQLGMALLNEGKMAEAVTSFETYVKLAPTGPNAATAKSMIAQLKK